MAIPDIDYGDTSFGVYKIAYDLAMLYAKSKFDYKLQSKYDFDVGAASEQIEELEYLSSQFFFAFEYLSNREPGEIEKLCEWFHNGELPHQD